MILEDIKLLLPTDKPVFFDYGAKYDGRRWWSPNRVHYGVDYRCDRDPVYACHDGAVVTGNDGNGWGMYIKIVSLDGYETVYAHLSKRLVKHKQLVKAGDMIAISGKSGSAGSANSSPHLHLELRIRNLSLSDTGPMWQQNPTRCFVEKISDDIQS